MIDPRTDLVEDTLFWELVLACATKFNEPLVFGNLHGLRCSGARLSLRNKSLVFKFSDEWNDTEKEYFKNKYAIPYLKEFKLLFKFVGENFERIKASQNTVNSIEDLFMDGCFANI